jgi:hypothetical protein
MWLYLLAFLARIEGIAQTVAEQVNGEYQHHNGKARKR